MLENINRYTYVIPSIYYNFQFFQKLNLLGIMPYIRIININMNSKYRKKEHLEIYWPGRKKISYKVTEKIL